MPATKSPVLSMESRGPIQCIVILAQSESTVHSGVEGEAEGMDYVDFSNVAPAGF